MRLSEKLEEILGELNLTPYAAAHVISTEVNEPITTINKRLRRCLTREPKAWEEIDAMVSALGYEIQIVKKNDKDE